MVQINFAQKSVTVKIVYYGPGMSGKTTNLEIVHQRAPENSRGDLTSISTDGDRTLFFDFMPLDLGTVAGMRTQFQIYTVPGQVYYNSTRKLVLQGVDGVIFVADSSASMLQENLESLKNLEENLTEYGKDIETLPYVIQYNKRDLPDAMPVEELEKALNARAVPSFEASANTGQGVFPTLKGLAALVLDAIHEQTGTSASRPAASPQGGDFAAPTAPQPPVQSAGTGFYPAPAASTQSPAPQPPAAPPQPTNAPVFSQPAAATSPAPPQHEPEPAPRAEAPPQPPSYSPPANTPPTGAPPPGFAEPAPLGHDAQPVQPSAYAQPEPQAPAPNAPAHQQPVAQQPPLAVDAFAKTQVQAPPAIPGESHASPPSGPQPIFAQQAPGPGEPQLRMARTLPMTQAPGMTPQPGSPAAATAMQPAATAQQPLMHVPASAPVPAPAPAPTGRSMPAGGAAGRIKPRSSALPTPKDSAAKRGTMATVIFVTLALAAGIAIGALVFNAF